MANEKINIVEKLKLFNEHWSPKIIGEINDSYIKLAKFKGDFVWHKYEEDELFLVIQGNLVIKLRERDIILNTGELFIVPKGIEHMPIAKSEVQVMLIESKNTLNTGDADDSRRQDVLDWI